ncbi:MAG: acyltransferase family protein [Olegusella sp.]|nr:acyltransferase family protein [Olegusella sp.]
MAQSEQMDRQGAAARREATTRRGTTTSHDTARRRDAAAQQERPHRRVDAVDGLRALCALAVVGYHMGLKWMTGGLLGVTVLFVLTGYFTTNSLLAEFSRTHGSVSLKDYFGRRIRRLIPQAYACIGITAALCTIFNHILLTKMRPDVVPALFGYLNWSKILTKVSYFAAAGAPSPLTHFWSLAIEWQFYLVWAPLLVLLLHFHTPKKGIRVFLLVGAVASAVLMAVLYTPGEDPSRSYYGTDTRAVSLLVGCWLAFVAPMRKISAVDLGRDGRTRTRVDATGTLAIVAIVILMVFTKGYTNFSYYGGIALVSVLAAVALGCLLPDGTILSRVLSLPPLVWIGQRSYALYLWHYPIVLLTAHRGAATATPVWLYLLQLALSIAAAEVSYRFVERPCGERGALTGALRDFAGALRSGGFADWFRAHTVPFVSIAAVLAVGLIGLVAAPSVDAAGGTGAPGEERAQASAIRLPSGEGEHDITIIGDSVPLGAADDMAKAFPYALVDCKVSRQMSAGAQLLADYVSQGVVGDTVVSCLGTNGSLTEEDIDAFVQAAGSDRTVWLVNNRVPSGPQDANNALLASYADAHDNVNLIDWYATSAGHDDWFWDDGTHLRPDGAAAYTQMLVDALGYSAPATRPAFFSALILGDTVALNAVDDLSAAFPAGAVDCSQGRGAKGLSESLQGYTDQGSLDGGTDVVISIGAEAPLNKDDLQKVIDKLDDAQPIWLVTVRTSGDWQDANNKILAQLAEENDNVRLIDWYAASEGHGEYLEDDGTTLTADGAKAFTATVTQALGGA